MFAATSALSCRFAVTGAAKQNHAGHNHPQPEEGDGNEHHPGLVPKGPGDDKPERDHQPGPPQPLRKRARLDAEEAHHEEHSRKAHPGVSDVQISHVEERPGKFGGHILLNAAHDQRPTASAD